MLTAASRLPMLRLWVARIGVRRKQKRRRPRERLLLVTHRLTADLQVIRDHPLQRHVAVFDDDPDRRMRVQPIPR